MDYVVVLVATNGSAPAAELLKQVLDHAGVMPKQSLRTLGEQAVEADISIDKDQDFSRLKTGITGADIAIVPANDRRKKLLVCEWLFLVSFYFRKISLPNSQNV